MLKIAIVIFRECLEIALLIGIILASTKHIKNSRMYVLTGAMIGLVLASSIAFCVRGISRTYGPNGDVLLDAAIILITTIIISWTVVWMQGYTQKIKHNIAELSEKITAKTASTMILTASIAVTILREGAEIILFIYSIASTEQISANDYIIGLGIGGISGFIAGVVIYLGIIKLSGKYIFKVSTILLIFIAAGLASQAAGILTSAGVINIMTEELWDSSWFVGNNTIIGKILSTTIGYDSKPNGIQLIFYLVTILFTVTMIKLKSILTRKKHA